MMNRGGLAETGVNERLCEDNALSWRNVIFLQRRRQRIALPDRIDIELQREPLDRRRAVGKGEVVSTTILHATLVNDSSERVVDLKDERLHAIWSLGWQPRSPAESLTGPAVLADRIEIAEAERLRVSGFRINLP